MNQSESSNNALALLFDNPRPRCPVALLLDTSSSMAGFPIEELQRGVRQFFEELGSDDCARFSVDLTIITFGNEVQIAMPFTTVADMNSVGIPEFSANGMTPMGAALQLGMREVSQRKATYRKAGLSYYQPWLVVLTDGEPNDAWENAASTVQSEAIQNKLIVMGVGVGPHANLTVLKRLTTPEMPPRSLTGLRFSEFFRWLTQTLRQVTRDSTEKGVEFKSTRGWSSF